MDLCDRIVEQGIFEEAEYFQSLVLSFDPNNADVYWGICLAKVGAKADKDILNSSVLLKNIPEFNKTC